MPTDIIRGIVEVSVQSITFRETTTVSKLMVLIRKYLVETSNPNKNQSVQE